MIKFEDVFKSYNGTQGCMCGCLGDYKLPTHTSIADANDDVGYDGHGPEDISDRSVRFAVKKINELVDWEDEEAVKVCVTDQYACVDGPTGRRYAVYFTEHVQASLNAKRDRRSLRGVTSSDREE